MARDRLLFPLSLEAAALLGDFDGPCRWERVELDDGDAAQALVPGVPVMHAMPLHGPDSGPSDDLEPEGSPTGELFDD